jgi:methylated-DNA-[protein]-cysteine S-methyltransferase
MRGGEAPLFAVFDTPIGRCAIVWGARGVTGVMLPEAEEGAMRARLRRRFPDAEERAPEGAAREAVAGMVALLRGEARDLSGVVLDEGAVPAFNRRVYAVARAIPAGRTMTYGEVAALMGERGAARAVGRALGENPFPLIVPCHRVLAAEGMGGFSAPGGAATKRRILEIEGAVRPEPTLPGLLAG